MAGPHARRAIGAETVRKSNPYQLKGGNQPSRVTVLYRSIEIPMASSNDNWFQTTAAREIHLEQLKQAERFNGRAAMLGIVIGIITEGLTGAGIAHQIGLGPLVDGYAACRTQFLPFCF